MDVLAMTGKEQLEQTQAARNPLGSTPDDHALTALRVVISLLPIGSAIGEVIPSATERQTKRAILVLQSLVLDLEARLDLHSWSPTKSAEDLDAAVVRSLRAAQETSEDEKREFIWYALINGWVRTHGNPNRDRFQRLVAKYDLEHFNILRRMRSFVMEDIQWFAFESGSDALVNRLDGNRDDILSYLQEFASDGLVMIYDQPDVTQSRSGVRVSTKKNVQWKRAADDLLNFVMDPRNIVSATLSRDGGAE